MQLLWVVHTVVSAWAHQVLRTVATTVKAGLLGAWAGASIPPCAHRAPTTDLPGQWLGRDGPCRACPAPRPLISTSQASPTPHFHRQGLGQRSPEPLTFIDRAPSSPAPQPLTSIGQSLTSQYWPDPSLLSARLGRAMADRVGPVWVVLACQLDTGTFLNKQFRACVCLLAFMQLEPSIHRLGAALISVAIGASGMASGGAKIVMWLPRSHPVKYALLCKICLVQS